MSLRAVFVRLHRYAGLVLAVFLAIAGITGSLISFDDELDALLNPSWFRSDERGTILSPSALVGRVESALPRARVTQWGACCLAAAHLLPFLYRLHNSLTLPGVWGVLLMGGVGILWTLDCFIGFALTLPRTAPRWSKWKTAWRVKPLAGRFRRYFDLHRATGLWLWPILLVMATSGVAMDLPDQVFRPVVSLFSRLAPSWDQLARVRHQEHPGPSTLSYDDAIALARLHASNAGWHAKPVYALHSVNYGVYGVGFVRGGEDGTSGLGPSRYFFDDRTGAIVREEIVGEGSAGDIYAQAQYQLHTGRILGTAGRALICGAGLATAGLSATGVYVWLRKRRSRRWAIG